MFILDLSANVPLYGQQMCYWCGAASGQMVRNGYPKPADRSFYQQIDVWNTIQVYNSTNPSDSGWATDPHGLTGCLQNLANPPGVDWVEYDETSRDAVLFFMLYWMNQRQYPSPTLVNQGGHWVVVVGYETDVEPRGGTTPTLQQLTFHDPEPHNIGTITTMSAAQWYGGPWNGAVVYTGTWQNEYVAVVEPPIVKGAVKVKQVKRTGKTLLSVSQAVEHARRWIEELRLAENPRYGLLARRDVDNLEPMLVREEPVSGSRSKNVPHYFVVPFSVRGESEKGDRLARLCILVNAYTGQFEEVTAFGMPVRYMSREAALAAVASAMHVDREKLGRAEATLMFRPSKISHIRSFPFWQIKVGRKIIFVDQIGQIYGKIELSVPGD